MGAARHSGRHRGNGRAVLQVGANPETDSIENGLVEGRRRVSSRRSTPVVRPYVSAAVALVGVGAMAVSPVTIPPRADVQVETTAQVNAAVTKSVESRQQETWNRVVRALSTKATPAESAVAYTALVDLLASVSPIGQGEQGNQQRAIAHQLLSGVGEPASATIDNGGATIAAAQVTPDGPGAGQLDVSDEARAALAGEGSNLLNIPLNLIQDIVNIPYNFIEGANLLGQALLFSGSWWLASSTNVWGTDPGDPAHWEGITALFPFPAFSQALAKQIWGLSAVLFPINSGCNDVGCPDGGALNAGYLQPARILQLLMTGKYTFDNTPVTYPDGVERPAEGLWNFGGKVDWGDQFGHPEWNTVTDPVTGRQVVPWAGTTFQLDLLSPFTDYWFDHLTSDPSSPENKIKLPTLSRTIEAFTTLASGVFTAFSPFFPGSWYCLSLCDPMPPKAPYYWDDYPFATDWPTLLNTAFKGLTDFLADPFGLKPRPPWTPPPFGDEPTPDPLTTSLAADQAEQTQAEEPEQSNVAKNLFAGLLPLSLGGASTTPEQAATTGEVPSPEQAPVEDEVTPTEGTPATGEVRPVEEVKGEAPPQEEAPKTEQPAPPKKDSEEESGEPASNGGIAGDKSVPKSGDDEAESSGGVKEVKKPTVSTDNEDGSPGSREVKKSEPSDPSVKRVSSGGNEGPAAKKPDAATD